MANVIKLEEIVEGVILQEDVMNSQGVILLKKGLKLQEKHIKILKRWGVGSVTVSEESDLADDNRPVAEIIQEKTTEIRGQLDKRFSDCADNELMVLIKETVFDTRIEQIKKRYGKE